MNDFRMGRVVEVPPEAEVTFDELAGLLMLRAPIPADQIEKLPKPLWKGAWDGERAARCSECKGYHVLSNAIHLDYCGHALTTNRLLDADPYWSWEPMAVTDQGLPLFDKVGGLWIKLTVCGVTRLGYGDGSSPKEIIGDAIRNAAMRFGVALDLWSKADLHMDRSPGDGPTSERERRAGGREDHGGSQGGASGQREGKPDTAVASDQPPNQEALLALGDVCDEHGYDRRHMRELYAQWSVKTLEFADRTDLADAPGPHIYAFAAKLIEDATAEPDVSNDAVDPGQPEGRPDGDGAEPGGEPAVLGDGSPEGLDTSDVEKKDGEIF